jgi:hypothetical protein
MTLALCPPFDVQLTIMKRTNRRARTETADTLGQINLELFPPVPDHARPKRLVFDTLPASDLTILTDRGYEPVLLFHTPRRDLHEDVIYLGLLMQGVAEGTVVIDKSRESGLHYELRTKGLLNAKAPPLNPHAKQTERTLDELLDWNESPHTMAATTIVPPEKIRALTEAAEKLAAKQGKKK